ncbi:5-(carboxyamino)imidazole ribonucleotide mutase [Myxococcota bacterium]
MSNESPVVSVIVGSASDEAALVPCRKALDAFALPYEARVLSAHRTPAELVEYVTGLEGRGLKVVIAAAGMAAALPGAVAAHTRLPVLGVPLAAGSLQGVDALLSVAQMPGGVPVGCMGVGPAGGKNAAYLAARILAVSDEKVRVRLLEVIEEDKQKVLNSSLSWEY